MIEDLDHGLRKKGLRLCAVSAASAPPRYLPSSCNPGIGAWWPTYRDSRSIAAVIALRETLLNPFACLEVVVVLIFLRGYKSIVCSTENYIRDTERVLEDRW